LPWGSAAGGSRESRDGQGDGRYLGRNGLQAVHRGGDGFARRGDARGQRALLAGYGVTAKAMGVAVKTDMETVVLGTNPVGLPIYFDRNAHQADGIVLINRVKPHTDFRGTHESGVLKMLVIGLGKREGASQVHKLGLRE